MLDILVSLFIEASHKPIEYVQPAVAEAYYEQVEAIETVEEPKDETACSCVKSARLVYPNLARGDADGFVPNSTMLEGNVAKLDYNGTIHITAYKLTPTGLLTLSEGNFKRCQIISRIIPWEEVEEHIVGFIKVPVGVLTNAP